MVTHSKFQLDLLLQEYCSAQQLRVCFLQKKLKFVRKLNSIHSNLSEALLFKNKVIFFVCCYYRKKKNTKLGLAST